MELWEEEGNNPATRKNVICAQKEWVGEWTMRHLHSGNKADGLNVY